MVTSKAIKWLSTNQWVISHQVCTQDINFPIVTLFFSIYTQDKKDEQFVNNLTLLGKYCSGCFCLQFCFQSVKHMITSFHKNFLVASFLCYIIVICHCLNTFNWVCPYYSTSCCQTAITRIFLSQSLPGHQQASMSSTSQS